MKKVQHIVFDHDGTLVDTNQTKSLYSGIENLLEELSQKGVKLYVWTARERFSTVEFLKSLGIISRFEELSCSTDCAPKPNKEGLLDMLGQADPSTVIVVGDSGTDMVGAKNYGARSIAALWSVPQDYVERRASEMDRYGADFMARTVEDCKKQIFELI